MRIVTPGASTGTLKERHPERLFQRGNAVAALENVALWHERDISHSSVERIIFPDSCTLLDYMLDRLSPARYDSEPMSDLLQFLQTGGTWTGTDAQLQSKGNGLARLIVGSSEYQFV